MSAAQQDHLMDTIAGSMKGVTRAGIVERQMGHWVRVDARLAAGIAIRLGLKVGAIAPKVPA